MSLPLPKTEEELVAQFEKMMDDTAKGLATNPELLSVMTEKIAEHESFKKHLMLAGDIPTIKNSLSDLNKQIAGMTQMMRVDHLKDSTGLYKGIWGNLKTCHDFGLFIMASVAGHQKSAEKLKSFGYELDEKAMGGDANSTGGALVPTEFIPQLILLIEKYGLFRQSALPYPMGSDSALAPKLSSGLTVYCPGAGIAPTASDPGFQSMGMQAKKWMTLTAIDSELDEDAAIAIGELVGFLIATAFAKKEDEVGFLGDGTSTYFGHVGIAGALRAVDATIGNIKSLVVGTGNAYSELTIGDFEKILGTLPDYADGPDTAWYNSRYFYYTVMLPLALAANGTTGSEVIDGRGVREKKFLAYPVKFAHAMPKVAANSQICSVFGNLKMGAYLGDRRKLEITRSNEAFFTTDQIGIKGTERIAPTVHGVGDTTNAGPIVGLITAGS